MNLTQKFLTENDCFKEGRTLNPTGIMVHSTAVNQTDPMVFINAWNKTGVTKCVHAFVGQDVVYQTLPCNIRGWHAGGSANNTHIGFEICEDGCNDATYFRKVWDNAVELCVMLCKKFSLTEKDIVCHSEAYKLGIASNHADVMHWFPRFGGNMDIFRNAVKQKLEANMTKDEAKGIVKEKAGVSDSTIQFIADDYRYGDELIIKLATAINGGKLV